MQENKLRKETLGLILAKQLHYGGGLLVVSFVFSVRFENVSTNLTGESESGCFVIISSPVSTPEIMDSHSTLTRLGPRPVSMIPDPITSPK